MALEDTLTRIAVALEKLAGIESEKRGPGRPPKPKPEPAAVEVEAPAAAEPEPAAKAPIEARVYTADDVRTALVAMQKRTTPDQARTLLKEVGEADTLKSLKPEKYSAVIAAAEKA
jgi:3-oxoacyl-ACP reductase-like protein